MRARRVLYWSVGMGLMVGLLSLPARALANRGVLNGFMPMTTITVSTTLDDVEDNGNCTLREAVIAANTDASRDGCQAGTGLDTIVLPAGTYSFMISAGDDYQDPASGDLEVSGPAIIRGAGRDETIVDANRLDRIFETQGHVTIQDLTMQDGNADWADDYSVRDGGAGIFNHGTLILTNVKIAENFNDLQSGGGVKNDGDLTVENSLFFHNSSYGPGAAIENGGTARISQTRFEHNGAYSDGAIYNAVGATLVIDDSLFIDNSTLHNASVLFGDGKMTVRNSLIDCNDNLALESGAIWVKGGETLLETVTIERCVSQGSGGAIIQDGGMLQIVRSVIKNGAGNEGGGIALREGSLEVQESLISGNNAVRGAAIHVSGGSGLVINSTLVDNTVEESGAVYLVGGTIELRSVTLAGNTGGGLVVAGGTARVHNSILAGNGPDCSAGAGGIDSLGYNLVGDAAGCNWVKTCGDDLGSASQPINPKLGPLEDNGGPTWTVELQPGSPAVDDGDNANCPATDQRGFPRPKDGNNDGNASCDKGAYEVQEKAAVPTEGAPPSDTIYLPLVSR